MGSRASRCAFARSRALATSAFVPACAALLGLVAGCGSSSAGASGNDAGGWSATDGGTIPGADSGVTGGDDGGSPDGGGPAPGDAASQSDAGGAHGADGGTEGGGGADSGASGRQSLVWVWLNYPQSLAAVAANASSFTQVSPSLYDLNYAYTSGVAQMQSDNGPDNFDGLSSTQIAQQIHTAGMKCIPLIQAGAGNSGTDQGIQAVAADMPAGTQAAFISAMVQEAVTKKYDGYSLDWEVGGSTTYAAYGTQFVAFLGAFQAALHKENMQLQLIVGDWYVEQSNCSGNTGLVDLAAASQQVDQVIMMAYDPSLGTATTTCNSSVQNPANCGNDFGSDVNLMCAYVPVNKISIGLDSDPMAGNNPIAGSCISATEAAGIPAVAIWPESNSAGPNGSYAFCDTTSISPAGATWFQLLSGFLSY